MKVTKIITGRLRSLHQDGSNFITPTLSNSASLLHSSRWTLHNKIPDTYTGTLLTRGHRKYSESSLGGNLTKYLALVCNSMKDLDMNRFWDVGKYHNNDLFKKVVMEGKGRLCFNFCRHYKHVSVSTRQTQPRMAIPVIKMQQFYVNQKMHCCK